MRPICFMGYPLITSNEGIAMDNGNYFSRSWAMLTRDKGWIKPLLVMAAASLVPIVGGFGNSGYALEWARLTAWGVDSAPKQKDVDVGKCVSSGARAFVVSLGWGLVLAFACGIINTVFSLLPGTAGRVIAALVSLAVSVVSSIFGIAILVAQLRATIYEKVGAGYQPDRVFELIRRDTPGFLRVFLIQFVSGLIIGAIAFVFVVVCLMFFMPFFLRLNSGYGSSEMILGMLAGMIVPLVVICVLFGYVLSFVVNATHMLVVNALGLWMRQFDVPNWGRSEDPLPTVPGSQTDPAQQWQQPMQTQGGQPGAYGQPMQQTTVEQPMQVQPTVQQTMQAQQPMQRTDVGQTVQQPAQVQRTVEKPMQVAPTVQQEATSQHEQTTQQQAPQQQAPQQATPMAAAEQPEATIVMKPKNADKDEQADAESLFESMSDAIKENDRVEGD